MFRIINKNIVVQWQSLSFVFVGLIGIIDRCKQIGLCSRWLQAVESHFIQLHAQTISIFVLEYDESDCSFEIISNELQCKQIALISCMQATQIQINRLCERTLLRTSGHPVKLTVSKRRLCAALDRLSKPNMKCKHLSPLLGSFF